MKKLILIFKNQRLKNHYQIKNFKWNFKITNQNLYKINFIYIDKIPKKNKKIVEIVLSLINKLDKNKI